MKFICRTFVEIEKVRSYLMSLSLDKPVIITIDEYVKNRTNAQNRLMHQWFNKISEHYFLTAGEAYAPKAWKELLKDKFLGFDMMELPDGSVKAITKHTSDCSTTELTEFLEKIDHYAVTELGLMLPKPDDLYWEAMGITK
jgi:hypothetical protein